MKQIKTTAILAVMACAGLTACASVEVGGAPIALSPAMAEQARIGSVTTTTGWLDAEDDFADTFNDEVLNEMGLCAGGRHRLNLNIHVEALSRAPRLAFWPAIAPNTGCGRPPNCAISRRAVRWSGVIRWS